MYFSEGDIEGGEGGLFGDCFRVDEKAAVVLGFEQIVIVAVCVGGVVEEDDVEVPPDCLAVFGLLHIANYY